LFDHWELPRGLAELSIRTLEPSGWTDYKIPSDRANEKTTHTITAMNSPPTM